MNLRNLPTRLAVGAFVLHSGIEKWSGDEGTARRLPDKCTLELAAGDVIRMLTPGGGGWGPAGGPDLPGTVG